MMLFYTSVESLVRYTCAGAELSATHLSPQAWIPLLSVASEVARPLFSKEFVGKYFAIVFLFPVGWLFNAASSCQVQ